MHKSSILLLAFLIACTPVQKAAPERSTDSKIMNAPDRIDSLSATGTEFVGKFATSSAINTRRAFVSEYHGEVRFTLFANSKIDCSFWAEGRSPDEFISATSSLCSGRLQHDGSFEFQGVKLSDSPDDTFTMRGVLKKDKIIGDVIIGSAFSNAPSIVAPSSGIDAGEGVRFTATTVNP